MKVMIVSCPIWSRGVGQSMIDVCDIDSVVSLNVYIVYKQSLLAIELGIVSADCPSGGYIQRRGTGSAYQQRMPKERVTVFQSAKVRYHIFQHWHWV